MEETVILNFEVDQGAAEQQLKKVEGLILDNKKAQQELTKALKQGTITQDEYIDENIRLQQNLTKEQEQKKTLTKLLQTESNSRNAVKNRISQLVKEYDNLNTATDKGIKRADALEKELAQLNAQLTKGDKAAGLFKNQIGNYPDKLADAAKNIKVAGVSVGDLGNKLSEFVNPASAAVGVISALGAAYASSVKGARDLEKAQNTLSFAVQIGNEAFAELINSGEKTEGVFTRLTNSFLETYTPAVAAYAKILADAKERLVDLEISRAFAAGDAKEDERRAELARRERDNEKKALDERIAASQTIDDLLKRSGERSKIVIQAQIDAIKNSTVGYENNRQAQLIVAQLTAEIADKEEEITGKLTENVTAREKLIQLKKEELELFAFDIREANKPNVNLGQPGQDVDTRSGTATAAGDLSDPIIASSKARQEQFLDELKTVDFTEKQKQQQYIETNALREKLDREQLEREREVAQGTLAIGSSLAKGLSALAEQGSEEQKALALAGIAFDTASALAGGIAASQDLPYPANLAAMASTIAAVLAAIAEANAVISGYEEGGWTGPGNKHDIAGVVHADEYVVPKHINNSPAAQPHLAALERMRGGYYDGGYVSNTGTSSAQQALIMANAIRNLPTPVVSVVEITRNQNRIKARENVSTLRP